MSRDAAACSPSCGNHVVLLCVTLLLRALSVAADTVQWHHAAVSAACSGAQLHMHQHTQQQALPNPQPHDLPPLFDECTHAMLTALAFTTGTAVVAASAAAAAALNSSCARGSSAVQRRDPKDYDEFDLDSPSPPRPQRSASNQQQQQQQQQQQHTHEPHRLDVFTPSALVLLRSQQVPPTPNIAHMCNMTRNITHMCHMLRVIAHMCRMSY